MSYIPVRMTLLSTKTASNSASIEFKSIISSLYKTYLVRIRSFLPIANHQKLNMVWSTDNGATYIGANYQWLFNFSYANSAADGKVISASDSVITVNDFIDNTANSNTNIDLQLFNMNQVATFPSAQWTGEVPNGGFSLIMRGSGGLASSNQINAIKLFMDVGNIASGSFDFYGVLEP